MATRSKAILIAVGFAVIVASLAASLLAPAALGEWGLLATIAGLIVLLAVGGWLPLLRAIAVCVGIFTALFIVATLPFIYSDFAQEPYQLGLVYAVFAGMWLVAYLALGLPSHAVLAWAGLRRAHHYAVAGAIAGLILGIVNLTMFWDVSRADVDKTPSGLAHTLSINALYGVVAATIFWYAAVRSGRRGSGG